MLGPTPSPGTFVRLALTPGAPTGLVLPTTFIDPTQLSAQIPPNGTTRGTLTRLAILSQFTETAITTFLNATGG